MQKQDKDSIIAIIKESLPHAHIYLFGSRARKDHKEESDIDIAIDNNKKIDSHILSTIKEQIEESTIPFTVDIIDLNSISEEFKNEILKDRVLWI